MSTWEVFSIAGSDCRWEVGGRVIRSSKPTDEAEDAPLLQRQSGSRSSFSSSGPPRLPCMADLLLPRGRSNGDVNAAVAPAPMFSTGSGKSVLVKQSSIAKALSVLRTGDGQITISNSGDKTEIICGEEAAACGRDDAFSCSNSLFRTASGRPVDISSAGLVRAKTLLGLEEEEDNDHLPRFQGFQPPRKSSAAATSSPQRKLSHLGMKQVFKSSGSGTVNDHPSSFSRAASSTYKAGLLGNELKNGATPGFLQSEICNSDAKPPPIRFHTAGGRSLSVSSEALERARSLLGDPELGTFLNERDANDSAVSVLKESGFNAAPFNKEKEFHLGFTHPMAGKSKHISNTFISPLKSTSDQVWSSFNSENVVSGSCLIKKFDEVENEGTLGLNTNIGKPGSYEPHAPDATTTGEYAVNGTFSSSHKLARSSHRPLVDISNITHTDHLDTRPMYSGKRRLGRTMSVSSFKRPRISRFTVPLSMNISAISSGLSSSSESSCGKRTVSTKYPSQISRMYVKEYFGVPLFDKSTLEHSMGQERLIQSNSADKYTFCDKSGFNHIGVENFYHMLAREGASGQYASKEWVRNHYKWIVWKLSCYDRLSSSKSAVKFLTLSNVLEELKYRYEREVNHGHRSAVKRILEGDSSPSSMLILCISAIYGGHETKIENHGITLTGAENSNGAKVELTDGWYSVDALLDEPLSRHLAAGKLFIGQKLRIWGAGICGWVGPVSPLEAPQMVNLLLHINGTYRAHWADRLGFCKGIGAPLAFRCIKTNGGPVPQTLLGVTRIYTVLYKEKLREGGCIVRSEKMEQKMIELHNQRRSIVVEGVVSEFQRGMKGSHTHSDNDSEGAKIWKILETAAEPELLMAEMSAEQLSCFASYQAKLEVTKQSEMDKAIKKALQDAGLGEREVIPFMRVRVVGLTNYQSKGTHKEGLVTLWNPTEKLKNQLVEGQAFVVSGLLPVNSDLHTLYLQARGSTTKWQPLSPSATQHFLPFFSPRKAVSLSFLSEVPISSEFDIAALVVYIGEVYTAAQQKKQWVFVTDSSFSVLHSEEMSDSLLAISFCSSCMDDDSSTPINNNLTGSTVGFCNLIKRAKDQNNDLWIAEATENSTYSLSFNSPSCSHLKSAAASVQSWAKISSSVQVIGKLKEKILFILGDSNG